MGMRFSPRRIAGALLVAVALWYFSSGWEATPSHATLLVQRRREVSLSFDHAWSGYTKHCMGHDSLHPVTNTCNDDFGGWGATAIDTLSTAILMGKDEAATEIMKFIDKVDFTIVKGGTSIQVFEVVIRHFAGMISAYDLLNGPFSNMVRDQHLRKRLYEQMVRLGDILGCSFNTPSGVPRNWLDPALCTTDNGTTNGVAGVGTMILEFARLSEITGNHTYAELARRAESYLLAPFPSAGEPFPGLLGTFVQVSDGALVNAQGSWGSLSDSFYEYLLKAYVYDQRTYAAYLERWKVAADSTMNLVASYPYGRPDEVLLPYWEERNLIKAMDSLSWFAGGNFILGGMVTNNQTLLDFGIKITDAGGALYNSTASGLGPEFVHWTTDCEPGWVDGPCSAANSVRASGDSGGNFNLRPEALESWYYAYRATKDPKYQDWAWNMFVAINRVCKTESGFSAISDVNAIDGGKKLDSQESFVFAEVLKYMYLIHLDDPSTDWQVQDSRTGKKNTWVFNTEAHPLRVAGEPV